MSIQTSQASSHVDMGQNTMAPPSEMYAVPGIPAASPATFGVDLGEQLARDGIEVPRVVQKCTQAIEAYGEIH